MNKIDDTNRAQHVYPTYARNFLSYKWYKPILTGFVFAIVYLLLVTALYAAMGISMAGQNGDTSALAKYLPSGYDTMNVTDWPGTVLNLGTVVLMILALMIAVVIVRERPFSSYGSARGGWSLKVFFKCLLAAVFLVAVPLLVYEVLIEGDLSNFEVKFTLGGFLILTALGPLQCIAEEYVFRGLLMQALGSWTRIPIIAILLQAALFAAAHPYNIYGVAEIFISGLMMGIMAWIAKGIEASSAIHVANNMTAFYLVGLNLSTIQSNVSLDSVIVSGVINIVYTLFILFADRKLHWFDDIRKDDVAKWNGRIEAKRARKEARIAQKEEERARKDAELGKHAKR